jgi:hypothetical protein
MRAILAFIVSIGWGALVLSACGLGQSDVVARAPSPPRTAGGSGGEDSDVATAPPVDAGEDAAGVDTRDASGEADAGAGEVHALSESADSAGPDGLDSVQPDRDLPPPLDVCSSGAFAFCDDFEPSSGLWMESGGQWAIREDQSWGDSEAYGPTIPVASQAYVPSLAFGDMTAEARVFVTTFGPASITNRAEIFARYQDSSHNYSVSLSADGKLGLRKNGSGLGTPASVSIAQDQWHTLKIRVSGGAGNVIVEGSLDGALLTTAPDFGAGSTTSGTVAVGVYGATLAVFDGVRVSVP